MTEESEVAKLQSSLDKLSATFQVIANSLAYYISQSDGLQGKSIKDKIVLLDSLGFDRNVIASVLGSTPNSVSAQLSKVRKERGY